MCKYFSGGEEDKTHLRSVSWGCPDASLFKGYREITIAILQARKRSQWWQQDQCESTEVAKVCAKCSQTLDLSDGPRFCQMGLKVGILQSGRWSRPCDGEKSCEKEGGKAHG